MTPAERTAFLRSDEDDEDHMSFFLADRPRGRCPWCGAKLMVSLSVDAGSLFCSRVNLTGTQVFCPDYQMWDSEDENRIRYASQRLAESKIEARVP